MTSERMPGGPATYPRLQRMSVGALLAGFVLGLLQPLFVAAVGGFGFVAGPSPLGLLFLLCLAVALLFGLAALASPSGRGTTVPTVIVSALLALGMVGGNWVAATLHITFAAPRPAPTPVGPGWTATGEMLEGRYEHTATLLLDGRVLVAGGRDDRERPRSSAELFDQSTGSWTATGAMIRASAEHTAVLLGDGRVLVITSSGEDGELYDPGTGTWSVTGSLITTRPGYTATLLPDGRVLVAGGIGSEGTLASAELFDPGTGTWSEAQAMGAARSWHSATLLADGRVLVAGGQTTPSPSDASFSPSLASAEIYDPATVTWSPIASMRSLRARHAAVLLGDGSVLVLGGGPIIDPPPKNEVFDARSGTWREGNAVTSLFFPTAVLLDNGRVLAMSGLNGAIEIVDPRGASAAGQPSGGPRQGGTATLLPDGRVLFAGGHVFFTVEALATAYLYDPS